MNVFRQHVGTRKSYAIALATDDGTEHPIAGRPTVQIIEHLNINGEQSVRPLAKAEQSSDGLAVTIAAFAWPGIITVEVQADAPDRCPDDPLDAPCSTNFAVRFRVAIDAVPKIPKTLRLQIKPARNSSN